MRTSSALGAMTPFFADEFSTWFKKQRMSKTELAVKVGTNRVTVRNWLKGRSFPRDEYCGKLHALSQLNCFGSGRELERAKHEDSIPQEVKDGRREKYKRNADVNRARAMDSYHKRYEAKRKFVDHYELEGLRKDPRSRKNICRECGEILPRDAGPHVAHRHPDVPMAMYKAKWGFCRSRNATRSDETNARQSAAMKRIRHQPPKWTRKLLPRAQEASLRTNQPGSARLEERLNARGRKLEARPKYWKRTDGDIVTDAKIAQLRLRGLTCDEIAASVGMTLTPVFFRLKRMGFPRRARIFLHGDAVRVHHLRVLCTDCGRTKAQIAEQLGITLDWTNDLFHRASERPLSHDLGAKFLKLHREFICQIRVRPASVLGGRPRQLPESERAELPAKYNSLLADLQAVRRWVRAQEGRLSLAGFWDWACRESRAQRFQVLHLWPAFFEWVTKGYDSSGFLSGDWRPNELTKEFLADDYDVSVDVVSSILTHC